MLQWLKNKSMKARKIKSLFTRTCMLSKDVLEHFSMSEFIKKPFGSSYSLNSAPVSNWLIIKYSERSISTSANISNATFPPHWWTLRWEKQRGLDDVNRSWQRSCCSEALLKSHWNITGFVEEEKLVILYNKVR